MGEDQRRSRQGWCVMAPRTQPILERLERHSIPEPNTGCWLWLGSLNENGYGYCDAQLYGRREARAHRVSYIAHFGPISEGLYVCHRCDVRSCVNPDHLFLGTPRDNIDDMVRKGRAKFQGRPAWSLTAADVLEIRSSSEGSRALAARYGVDKRYIWAVRTGTRGLWKSVPLHSAFKEAARG